MKTVLYLLISLIFFLCDCKNEAIEPSKIVKLNIKEIDVLTKTSFVISEIRGSNFSEKLSFLKDADFNFDKNGLILSKGESIGKWTIDRWIYLHSIDSRILINLVSEKNMKIYLQYFDCKTEKIIEESIHLVGKFETSSEVNNSLNF